MALPSQEIHICTNHVQPDNILYNFTSQLKPGDFTFSSMLQGIILTYVSFGKHAALSKLTLNRVLNMSEKIFYTWYPASHANWSHVSHSQYLDHGSYYLAGNFT